MRRRILAVGGLWAGILFQPVDASAAAYYVPSIGTPTLQSAIDQAAGAGEAENTIYIGESPLFVTSTITIPAVFDCGQTLTIRPDPGDPTRRRVTIASTVSNQVIFALTGCSCVTLQDLDIVRDITNAADLVLLDHTNSVVIERCRIGSIWSVPGAPNCANLRILYPTEVVVRNCIFFAYAPGTFDRGIVASSFNDPSNALLLYNNVVSDYRLFGIDVSGSAVVGPMILLRNNVVVNHLSLVAEPTCFRSDVNGNMLVVTSHNAVFATPGFAEALVGVQRISSIGTGTFLGMGMIDAPPSFAATTWDLAPAWDPNPDFYRLLDGNLLHNDAGDLGVNVAAGVPHARDVAVTDDIEKDPRPGATPAHTDRGADQIEAGVSTAVVDLPAANGLLWAAPRRNPARGNFGISVRSVPAGDLTLAVFDPAGRCVHRAHRTVPPFWTGVLEWPGVRSSGQLYYRLQLTSRDGRRSEVRGRITLVR